MNPTKYIVDFTLKILVSIFILIKIHTFIHSQILDPCLYPYKIMGSAGFEPTTSGTQNPNHAKLDHDPDVNAA